MPLIDHVPDSWRPLAASIAAMITLAGLDFIGALFARDWAERGRAVPFLLGLGTFALLFVVYARILQVAELSTVTIGWVVFLQVGLIAMDVFRYDVHLSRGKIVAIAAILLLQGYLVLVPNDSPHPAQAVTPPASTTGDLQAGPVESFAVALERWP